MENNCLHKWHSQAQEEAWGAVRQGYLQSINNVQRSSEDVATGGKRSSSGTDSGGASNSNGESNDDGKDKDAESSNPDTDNSNGATF